MTTDPIRELAEKLEQRVALFNAGGNELPRVWWYERILREHMGEGVHGLDVPTSAKSKEPSSNPPIAGRDYVPQDEPSPDPPQAPSAEVLRKIRAYHRSGNLGGFGFNLKKEPAALLIDDYAQRKEENAYMRGRDQGYDHGRRDAIEECRKIVGRCSDEHDTCKREDITVRLDALLAELKEKP